MVGKKNLAAEGAETSAESAEENGESTHKLKGQCQFPKKLLSWEARSSGTGADTDEDG
jgi:hypothetical protein